MGKKNCPSIQAINGAGTVLMFSNIGERNIKAMLVGTTSAIFLISVILAISLKSTSMGLISLVANLVPAVIGFGIWGGCRSGRFVPICSHRNDFWDCYRRYRSFFNKIFESPKNTTFFKIQSNKFCFRFGW